MKKLKSIIVMFLLFALNSISIAQDYELRFQNRHSIEKGKQYFVDVDDCELILNLYGKVYHIQVGEIDILNEKHVLQKNPENGKLLTINDINGDGKNEIITFINTFDESIDLEIFSQFGDKYILAVKIPYIENGPYDGKYLLAYRFESSNESSAFKDRLLAYLTWDKRKKISEIKAAVYGYCPEIGKYSYSNPYRKLNVSKASLYAYPNEKSDIIKTVDISERLILFNAEWNVKDDGNGKYFAKITTPDKKVGFINTEYLGYGECSWEYLNSK